MTTPLTQAANTELASLMHNMGQSARAASALMGKAAPGPKNTALRELARLLRSHTAALQTENEKDLSAARAAGLAEPMVDRLKLSPAAWRL